MGGMVGNIGSGLSNWWQGLGSGPDSYGTSTVDKLATIANSNAMPQIGGQKDKQQQQPAAPVNFNIPAQPYVPPPTMAPGYSLNSPNPFYGG